MIRKILTAVTAANGIPSGATAGVPLRGPLCTVDYDVGDVDALLAVVKSTAGSGTMVAKVKIWGYVTGAACWVPLLFLNAGADIAEAGADNLAHSEIVRGVRECSRIYAEVVSIGGTATAVEVWIAKAVVSNGEA